MTALPNLQINPQRLWDCADGDRQVRRHRQGRHPPADAVRRGQGRSATGSRRQCEALGCTVTVDEVGNMFARRPGRRQRAAADLHGLAPRHPADRRQVRRRARRARRRSRCCAPCTSSATRPTRPIEVVNWTNEEGSRFAPAMLASGVFAGAFTPTSPTAAPTATARRSATSWSGSAIAAARRPGGAQARRHVRAAHRAGADPRGRGQG